MADLTEEQRKQIEAALAAAASRLNADNTVKVIVMGNASLIPDNPRFKVEQRRD